MENKDKLLVLWWTPVHGLNAAAAAADDEGGFSPVWSYPSALPLSLSLCDRWNIDRGFSGVFWAMTFWSDPPETDRRPGTRPGLRLWLKTRWRQRPAVSPASCPGSEAQLGFSYNNSRAVVCFISRTQQLALFVPRTLNASWLTTRKCPRRRRHETSNTETFTDRVYTEQTHKSETSSSWTPSLSCSNTFCGKHSSVSHLWRNSVLSHGRRAETMNEKFKQSRHTL